MPGISLTRSIEPDRAKGVQFSAASVGTEPITTVEVGEFLSIADLSGQRGLLLESLIAGVRQLVEKRIGRLLVERDVTAYWKRVPEYVTLPLPPHGAIDEVRRYSSDDTIDVLPTDKWYSRGLEAKSVHPTGGARYGLEVDYTAGYDTLPDGLKMQTLRDVKDRFDQRDGIVEGQVTQLPDPSAYDAWRVLS